ncbi:hypothetical protein SSX86_007070 [Deinandra increscens subsp. villosa]|uniref:CLAVATA3/ESR (CLE)-related protein 13 n=1 Tax=Deinandra increscens subsp. villosa TaxID=3103831 RepID=A0AAP0H7F7_9ASTR
MAMKISLLLHLIFWLSLIFLIIFHVKSKTITIATTSPLRHHRPLTNRKTLASNFDFTPFLKHHHLHHHHHHHHDHNSPELSGSQIDPRYGVEKRLVPTGPNPLHH